MEFEVFITSVEGHGSGGEQMRIAAFPPIVLITGEGNERCGAKS